MLNFKSAFSSSVPDAAVAQKYHFPSSFFFFKTIFSIIQTKSLILSLNAPSLLKCFPKTWCSFLYFPLIWQMPVKKKQCLGVQWWIYELLCRYQIIPCQYWMELFEANVLGRGGCGRQVCVWEIAAGEPKIFKYYYCTVTTQKIILIIMKCCDQTFLLVKGWQPGRPVYAG